MHSGLFINFFRTHFATMETLVFAIIIFGLWVLELVIAEQPWKRKLQHTTANALFVTTALPIQIFMFVFLMAMASWVKANHWGLIQFIPGHRQIVVRYIALFFMMDFFEYIYHRCMHGMPTLWKFHLVHHSDRILDVSTTVREHPVETIVRNAFMILWVFICGTNFGVILIRQIVQSFADIFAHTNLQLPPKTERFLSWFFVTPSIHRVHHHNVLPYTNSNYGDVFSIWDRLFGSVRFLPKAQTVIGLDTHMGEGLDLNFLRLVAMPFRRGNSLVESESNYAPTTL